MNRCFPGLIMLLTLFVATSGSAAEKWMVIHDCRLIANAANDGDSFHVRGGGREYLARLYFVDAPESSMQVPARVREQAGWFGTTEKRVLEQGALASARVAEWLDQPFTLYTQLIDAGGASRTPRVFAMVRIGDRYLCELLVENGLARIYGIRRHLHDGTSRWDHVHKLEALEKKAKAAGAGIWGTPRLRRSVEKSKPSTRGSRRKRSG